MAIDLTLSSTELTRLICDIPSVSGDERILADEIEQSLAGLAHLEVIRHGNTIAARIGEVRRDGLDACVYD